MEHCLNLSLTCSATPKEMLGWWQRSYIKIKPPLREGCAADPGVVSTKLTEGLKGETIPQTPHTRSQLPLHKGAYYKVSLPTRRLRQANPPLCKGRCRNYVAAEGLL